MMTHERIGLFVVRGDQLNILKDRSRPTSGIYRIINLNNGNSYVGSTKNLRHRLISHSSALSNGNHSNSHLQNSFNKLGDGSFVFFIEKLCKNECLLESENEAIVLYKSMDRNRGYNMQMGVRDDSVGRWSEEVKIKISESNKKTFSSRPEICKKNSARLTLWHKNNPGIAGGPRNRFNFINETLGLEFYGCANELIRKYPDHKLYQSAIWRLSRGLAKHHKGWTVAKPC